MALFAAVLFGAGLSVASAEVVITGDVQYRFEYNYYQKDSASAKYYTSSDYKNKYAWDLFLKATPVDKLLLGVRLSNPAGYNMDNIAGNPLLTPNPLAIPEFYFKWTPDPLFALSAGIIPVYGSTVRDLTMFEGPAGYLDASKLCGPGVYPWAVGMNNSMKGVEVGSSFLTSKDFSIGADLIYALASDWVPPNADTTTATIDELGKNQYRFDFTVPMTFLDKMITATPELSARTNVYRSTDYKKANHSAAGGLDVTAKPIKGFLLKAGFAYGQYSNSAIVTGTTTQIDPAGFLLNDGLAYTLPFMSILLDHSFGMCNDRHATTKVSQFLNFWDLKFPIPITKLTLIPRIRVWYYGNSSDDHDKLWIRPEFNLKAAF
jgi:hypothetical protein